jgi:hypothetical protein
MFEEEDRCAYTTYIRNMAVVTSNNGYNDSMGKNTSSNAR